MMQNARANAATRVITTTSDPTTTTNKTAELEQARRTLISLIKARQRDRYAALLSRALTTEAQTLVRSVFSSFAYWQRNTGKRVRKYGADSDAFRPGIPN
jgi:hypothetical protein